MLNVALPPEAFFFVVINFQKGLNMYTLRARLDNNFSFSEENCQCSEQQEGTSLPGLCSAFGGKWEKGKKGQLL